jgi:hypothetical protein
VPTYPHRAYQGGDLPSQGPSNLGGQEFGSGRFYASSSNFVPARNSFSGFEHHYSATFRQGVCSEHGPICHLFEWILVIHANTSNGTDHICRCGM